MAVLRAELGRAEAAVEGGKKQRDTDIAALENKLNKCQQELGRLETEVGAAASAIEKSNEYRPYELDIDEIL